MTKARIYNSQLISELMAEASVDELRLTEKKMLLAVRIADAVKKNFRHKNDFAAAIGKKPSEISKWLSGTHNFTTETLFEIERVLDIQLVTLESKPASYVSYYISIKSPSESTGDCYQYLPDMRDQVINVFEGRGIVSEKKHEYVTN
jgi:transcriptional regulator with XRE-family HTH domain